MIKFKLLFFTIISMSFTTNSFAEVIIEKGKITTIPNNNILFQDGKDNNSEIIHIKPPLQKPTEHDKDIDIEVKPEIYINPYIPYNNQGK